MKTLAKTIFAAALTAVLFTSSAMATFAAEPVQAETKTSSLSILRKIFPTAVLKTTR